MFGNGSDYKFYMENADYKYEYIDTFDGDEIIFVLDYTIRVKHFKGKILVIERDKDLDCDNPFYLYTGNENQYYVDRDELIRKAEGDVIKKR